MKRLIEKPVVFLAFANDRVRENAYLRNLPEELRGIRRELDNAQKNGLCELVVRANATIDDLLDVFQDPNYKDRIAVFHYGGHADTDKLLLEDFVGGPSSTYKEGLVSFFARQKSLKLIFLNACFTIHHARELTDAGIPAVIGTLDEIDDNIAFILANRFYKGLACGLSIERAWHGAESEIRSIVHPSENTTVYREITRGHGYQLLWQLLYCKGAEKVKEWNLPDAADNPLFGLPPIPKTYPLPETPFLFLDRFTRKHAGLFFGRSHYIRVLYHRVTDKNASPIILLYGQSGVGKSSLLEAGLLPRLEETHTCLYIRGKQETLTKSFLGVQGRPSRTGFIRSRAAGKKAPLLGVAPRLAEGKKASLAVKWKEIETRTGKPLLIILDQVEEIFSGHEEWGEFLQALKPLFRSPASYPRGKLIVGFRKEYYPEIEARFRHHELPRVPVYVRPLNRRDIVEVVTGLTSSQQLKDRYCLEVEDPLPVIIADDLLEDKDSPVAPTLQILLTKMWHSAGKDPFSPDRRFSVEQYRELRKQGLLMNDFFHQQMEKIENWKKEVVHSGLALDLLKFHTTPLGTSCSRDIETIRQTYRHRLDIIDALVAKLKDAYLLTHTQNRENASETRLAHDTLAPIVIKEYNHSDKPGRRAARIIDAKIRNSHPGVAPLLLDENDLKIVEDGRGGMMALTPEGIRLLEESRKRKARQEKKIRGYRIARRVLSLLVFLFALAAVWQWNQAVRGEKRARADFLAARAQAIAEKDPTLALRMAEQALKMDNNPVVKRAIYKIYRENSFYTIMAEQTDAVTALAVSPDGTTIVTGSPHGVVSLWDRSGTIIRNFKAHEGSILSAAFSPDSNNILTGAMDGTARLWDLEGKLPREFPGHGGFVLSVTFSPDGRYILTGAMDKIARLWDLRGEQPREIRGHHGRVLSVAFSACGNLFLTASSDGSVRIWDTNGRQIRLFTVPNSSITSAAFSPDTEFIVFGCDNGKTFLLDIKEDELKEFPGHKQRVTSVSFSPRGRYILTASKDGTARLWDVNGVPLEVFKGHRGGVVSAVFSPDGKYVFTGSRDKTLRLWALKGRIVVEFDRHTDRVYDVAFSPGGDCVLTGSRDRTARIWDLKGNQLYNTMNHDAGVFIVGFSTGGKDIFTRTEDGKIHWWDLEGNPLPLSSREGKPDLPRVTPRKGKYTFTCARDGSVQLFDSEGNHVGTFSGHKGNVNAVDFSPDGKYMLTGSFDTTARLWEIPMPLQDFLSTGPCGKFTPEQLEREQNDR